MTPVRCDGGGHSGRRSRDDPIDGADNAMRDFAHFSDEDLLAWRDTEAFGVFYDRHVRTLLGYFARRTSNVDVAADLTAETFACAIKAQPRYVPTAAPAVAWLYTIAARRLADYHRRGAVERRMRRELAMQTPALGRDDVDLIRLLSDDAADALLAELPPDQRAAVAGRVVSQRAYPELAHALQTSESAVRQRVSRGLAELRRRLEGP
jgi:RNA polymerase sigma-70 factor (ECF subfamily)